MRFALIALIGATQAMRLTHGPPRQEGGDRPEDTIPGDTTIPGDGTVQGHSNPCPGEDCQEPGPMTDEEYEMRREMREAQSAVVFDLFDDLGQQLDQPGVEYIDLDDLEAVSIEGTDIEEHLKLEMKQEIAAFDFNGDEAISLDEMESARTYVNNEYAQWEELPENPTEEEEYDY